MKERQSKQGLCCVPATDCHIDKRKTSPQLVKIVLAENEFNFCKLSHFSSAKIRKEFFTNQKVAIKDAERKEQACVEKKYDCLHCQVQCSDLIGIKSRDSTKMLNFCCVTCLFQYGDIMKTDKWNKWVKENGKKPKKKILLLKNYHKLLAKMTIQMASEIITLINK